MHYAVLEITFFFVYHYSKYLSTYICFLSKREEANRISQYVIILGG